MRTKILALSVLILIILMSSGCVKSTDISSSSNNTALLCKGSAGCFSGTVQKIIDGDTLVVANKTIRLALVNTPESYEPGYYEAAEFTRKLCPIDSVAIVDEDDGQIEGSYDRMIALVHCGNKNLNRELLSSGYAYILQEYCNNSEFRNETWALISGCPASEPEIQTIPNETYDDLEYISLSFVNYSCYLDGDFFINDNFIKKTTNNILTLYWKDVANYVNKSGEDIICLRGHLPACFNEYTGWNFKECWYANLSQNYFIGYHENILADIHPRTPSYPFEMLNFVKPAQVKNYIEHWRNISVFNNDTKHDLEIIWTYVNTIFQYRDDMLVMGVAEYWRTPNETIDSWGDCEDWTNTFVSLALAYNSSLKCYSVLLPDHLTAFCKFPKDENSYEYHFYDKDTSPNRVISKYDSEKENKFRELMGWYFSAYNIYGDISVVFDDKQYFEFDKNENKDFIKWALYTI